MKSSQIRRPPAPKPYTLIDLPSDTQPERRKPAAHDTFTDGLLTGRLHIEIEALSPVHIATGLLKLTNDRHRPLLRELFRVDGVPVIPGSSLKGCVRSIVEAISRSCVRVTKAEELPSDKKGCDDKGRQLCVACRIFGAQDVQAPVRFGDLHLVEDPAVAVEIAEIPQLYKPRSAMKIYHRDGKVRGRKFFMHGSQQARGDSPIEVCRAGSHFRGIIDFFNLSPDQLGLLLVGLGQHHDYPFPVKLGGAKPACYGSARIGVTELRLADPRARYLDWDAAEDRCADPVEFLSVAQKLILKPQLQALAETLRWPHVRACPSGNY
ncbi:MAG: hypothetical protein KatS3mg057_1153 [Herpetosiphonaceae bacterium]|nr:MAG: hypothetical protein KatS3mg057_1153 [Herpetosiphonaceae bacterium]